MFDDDLSSPGGSRLESRLGDLASRHPELADHFYDFPITRKFGTIPRERGKSEDKQSAAQSDPRTEVNRQPETTTIGTQTSGLESDVKLRNTVPDMQASSGEMNSDSDRGQRSQSAPPQTPAGNKQNEEGVRLIPIRTDTPSSGLPHSNQQIPRPPSQHHFQQQHPHFQDPHPHFHDPHSQFQPSAPQQHFQQGASSQQQYCNDQPRHHEESKGPTVRHIPIFVEGRDEPLLPKDAGPTSTSKRGGCQGKTESAPPKRGPPPEEKKEHHQQSQNDTHHQTQQNQQPTPAPPPPPQKPDPLALVAEVVKDVEALTLRVNDWTGSSRTEKEYIYLDEMLTRNLLKLDNIETEGREEVRAARREAIKRIQAAISILESKAVADDAVVPVWQGNEGASNTGEVSSDKKDEPMETDSPAPAEASQEAANTSQHTQT